ncbi:MAG: cadmium-translocating P-type ATPase [Clostridia bacterium]|nr:cadmium-translocating P-type ATPase [Clostridia bacterium]
MKKFRYIINNLDCANCARKIEEALNKDSRFENVVVNFNTSKISLEASDTVDVSVLNEIAKKVEPEVDILEIKTSATDEKLHSKEYSLGSLVIAVICGIIAIKVKFPNDIINLALLVISYVLLIYKHLINSLKVLIKNKTINENLLIVISSLGAFVIGEVFEGIMVVALYTFGKFLEEKAINRTRSSVKELLDIRQNYANLKLDNDVKEIDVNDIKIGDILVVKKGERIPVDGVIIEGITKLDTSALTGESELVDVKLNSKILSGSINVGDVIEIKATEVYENSTVSRILTLMEEATDKKSKTETTVSKISKVYTPVVLILATLVAVFMPKLFDVTYAESLYRGLTFLVISCPCAIAISVPLSYFVGIGIASKNNILVKGSNYLDNLMHIKKIIFDKTGTLTTGAFQVTNIEIFDDAYSKEEVIDVLTKGESLSNHPIAKSIMKLAKGDVNNEDVEEYKEIAGRGISFELQDKKVKIGTDELCGDCVLEANVHLNIDGKHVASVIIDDGIKRNAKEAIEQLHKSGVKTYMFTGDQKEVALEIGNELGINEIRYEMLPADKFAGYEELSKSDPRIAFVGDGINDAPVLRRAFIGMSMGEIGSAAAIEASDVVLMKDDLLKIPEAIKISKTTNRIIKQNLIFAFTVKILFLTLSILGKASMWMAVFADTGVTVLTIFNTLRLKNKFKKKHESHSHACECHEHHHHHEC